MRELLSVLCQLLGLSVLLLATSLTGAASVHRHRTTAKIAGPSASIDASSIFPSPRIPYSLASSDEPIPLSSLRHPVHGSASNTKVDPDVDCALKAFAIEVATKLRPATAWSNWTALAEDAFQMRVQCGATTPPQPSASDAFASRPAPSRAEQIAQSDCSVEVFVDADQGRDEAEGSETAPVPTLTQALEQVRAHRAILGQLVHACITLRGGRYYLGAVSHPKAHSRVGGLHLTPADSNISIRPYAGEAATLSGGVPLIGLQWKQFKSTPAGTVMVAAIPGAVQLDPSTFNELYIDGVTAVRAKYPNGDPFWHGLYSSPTGYQDSAASWLPRKEFPPATQIHIETPSRNGTVFQYYDLGVDGGAVVFDPPTNFWSVARPNAGANYGVPSGLVLPDALKGRINTWGDGQGGLIHAFHSGQWGSWIFDIASLNTTSGTIHFGAGGFQEARGNPRGGQWYVSNLLAELDAPNEWFFDSASRSLYFMANQTMPTAFVASQRACVVSMVGSQNTPVKGVSLTGLLVTETSHTFMDAYEAPASGDWSIHRGGAIYLEGTEDVVVSQSLFTQLASNAIVVSRYNLNVTIDANEFVWLGDSSILIVGESDLIDGISNTNQPHHITVSRNFFHEGGAYVKQSAPTFIALSRQVTMDANLAFNVPRSCVNVNDGFHGNKTISRNVFFNSVRETADHGPINTWDRQPYLTNAAGNGPSLWPHLSFIYLNVLWSNYNSFYPIDHDDGSCYWEDSYNFQTYGGKKNYLGHSKTDHHEFYVYPDTRNSQGPGVCIADQAPTPGQSGWNEVWVNNTCVMYAGSYGCDEKTMLCTVYNIWSCDTSKLFTPVLSGNQFWIPQGYNASFSCEVNGKQAALTFEQWQALGLDVGSKVTQAPDVQGVIAYGQEMIYGKGPLTV